MADSNNGTPAFARDTTWSIYRRLNAVMSEIGHIDKDKTQEIKKDGRKVGEFDYISHDMVSATVRTPFVKYGIAVQPTVVSHETNGNRVTLVVNTDFINIDNPDDRVSVQTIGFGVDNTDKGPGKALSYAVKYAYLKILMLNSADDIEAGGVEHIAEAPNTKDIEVAKKAEATAVEAWANQFRDQIDAAPTEAAVDALQAANKKMLMAVPDATRDYFVSRIQMKKDALSTTPLDAG
jgi:hypothetical protein